MKKIWLNGCFDVLHHGHFRLIQYATSLGGTLLIGIDSDRRIQQMKGDDRPYHSENERVFNLMQIKGVDAVVVFDNDEMLNKHIEIYGPDIFVIGSDYKDKKIIGKEFCKEIFFFDRIDNLSTTNILEYDYNGNR